MAHRTQGNFLFTRLSVYCKKCNSGTARWKRCIGPGMGEGAQSFHVLSRQPSSQHLCAFSSPEPLWTPSFWVFMKAPLCSQEWLNHCTLSLIQPSVLLYSPEVWGMGLKVPTLQLWLVPSGNQPPSLGLSKIHLTNINSGVIERCFLWITKGTFVLITQEILGALCQDGVKTKYIFSL